MPQPTNFDLPGSLKTVWAALHEYRDELIPEGGLVGDEPMAAENEVLWDDITTAMAWITEGLGLDLSTADDSTNGEYVERPEVSQTEQDMDCIGKAARLYSNGYTTAWPSTNDCIKINEALERLGR